MAKQQLGPGAPVRHRKHHNLTGKVLQASQTPGMLRVQWDNNKLAFQLLGWLALYQRTEDIELRPAQDDIDALFLP